jgi:hypothetical protein
LAEEIRAKANRWLLGEDSDRLRIFEDTTDFFKIEFGDIILLGRHPFLIRHNAREGRFGVDDEVKYWVKRAIDLESGALKLLKLVFYEEFETQVAGIPFKCYCSPQKEARVLKLVTGHPHFMQGHALTDRQGNLIRVIDFIYGRGLPTYIEDLDLSHEEYFYNHLPDILRRFTECIDAVRFLHRHGEKHGDIRRDHIVVDRENDGRYRWIDFDYTYTHRDNRYGYDLFGLGNVLMYLVGKGDTLLPHLHQIDHPSLGRLTPDNLNIVFHHRVANLQKIYPYIPDRLNLILLHFSKGAKRFYETTEQLLADLTACDVKASADP